MINRRKFLILGQKAAGLALLAGVYTWKIEPYLLEFVHRRLPIRNLPAQLAGKNLLQISDIHVGNRFDNQFLEDSLAEAAKLKPDIVVYTGDYVSWEGPEQYEQLRKVLRKAPLGKLGTYAILGNHDYGKGWREAGVVDGIIHLLESAGITVLRNESARVAGLNIIGFDDLWGTNFNPPAAMRNYNARAANLVLCHNPDVCDMDVWQGYRGWILAGHTHGGQCKPPFMQPPILPVKNTAYTAGEFDLADGRRLYINRALGSSWPVRFNVRPEITVFELVKA